jgi:hypothetical protein
MSIEIIPDTKVSFDLRFMYILFIRVDVLWEIRVALVMEGMNPAVINLFNRSRVFV